MHEHSHPLTTNLRVALWSLRSEKEAGQSSALFPLCSADSGTGMDGSSNQEGKLEDLIAVLGYASLSILVEFKDVAHCIFILGKF